MEKDLENDPLIDNPRNAKPINKASSFLICVGVSLQFSFFAIGRATFERKAKDSVILFYSEVLKFMVSLLYAKRLRYSFYEWTISFIPCAAFMVMNMLTMYCTKYISASVFVVLNQLKLVFTAIFSVYFLKRKLMLVSSLALCTICLGCITAGYEESHDNTNAVSQENITAIMGLVTETMISGATGVLMQGIFNNESTAMWQRNVQISFMSMVVFFAVTMYDSHEIGTFATMSMYDALLSCLSATGGILVALSIRHCGALEKTISTSCAVCLTLTFEMVSKQSLPTFYQAISISHVIVGVLVYVYSI